MLRSFTPTLSIIIAVLIFLFFTKNQLDDVRMLQSEVKEYRVAVAEYKNFSDKLNDKINIIQSRPVGEREKLDQLLPTNFDEVRLLVDLEKLAQNHGLLFGNASVVADGDNSESVSYDENGEEVSGQIDALQNIEVSFGVIGTYEKLKTFLGDLEQSRTLFDVTSLSFSATEGDFYQFDITVRTYELSDAIASAE